MSLKDIEAKQENQQLPLVQVQNPDPDEYIYKIPDFMADK